MTDREMDVTILGFTGTQRGMTFEQRAAVASRVRHPQVAQVHHGDCVGADEQVHQIAALAGKWVGIHPPANPGKRAFCAGPNVFDPKDYLDRNHDIVDACDQLIAAPGGMVEELRSGTWATVRYARKVGKPVTVVYPDGSHETFAGYAEGHD